jgi:glycosyltransferase involved in cell wall biosynthesis
VTDGVEGFVFPVGDIAALSIALAKVLASPGMSRQMGEAAQRRIASWDFEADIRGLRQALAHTTGLIRP